MEAYMADTLRPEKLSKEAASAYRQRDYLAAARFYAAASHAYTAAGDAVHAAEMANNQSVALLKAGEAQAALECVAGTAGIFDQAGEKRLQAMATANYAAALEAAGQLAAAVPTYQQAADLLAACEEDELRLQAMQALSALQLRLGRPLEALASMQDGLAGVAKPSPKQRLIKHLLSGGLVRIP
jgi:hypothetical protein